MFDDQQPSLQTGPLLSQLHIGGVAGILPKVAVVRLPRTRSLVHRHAGAGRSLRPDGRSQGAQRVAQRLQRLLCKSGFILAGEWTFRIDLESWENFGL